MARSWIIDFEGFAKKVKNTNLSTADQVQDNGAYLDCPKCHYRIHNSDVFPEWPGFPAGVKFDPSDVELLEHLAAKCCIGSREAHMFIHEFIPTLEGDQGICYTHPENLPGAKKDGSCIHFFNRTVNAYPSGKRKRRKIHHQHEHGLTEEEHVRWHKTGKTKPVIVDGVHKGFKKFMVLYVRSGEGSKAYKSNWVMHQYHLGREEEEKDGEFVVSKVFYQQQKQSEKIRENPVAEDSDMASRTGPRAPKPNPPGPPCTDKCDNNFDENELPSLIQDDKSLPGESHVPQSDVKNEGNMGDPAPFAGESQDVCDFDGLEDFLLGKEMLEYHANEASYGTSVLDTPPDFDLSVFPEWPSFPAGVKFDPSDFELLEHLEAKRCIGNKETHLFIHEFIPTLEGDQGICYFQPENLPGAKKDGSSGHFFIRTVNAYATRQRKRRKIHHQNALSEEQVRWLKIGKAKAVIENGVHKGFKKTMVLYVRSQKGSKACKSNWVMHQYHLGSEEEEKDGEYVVLKVFYQQLKQPEKTEENPVAEDSDMAPPPPRTSPRAPNPNPPSRPPLIKDDKSTPGESHAPPSDVKNEDNMGDPALLATESQDLRVFDGLDDILSPMQMKHLMAFLY